MGPADRRPIALLTCRQLPEPDPDEALTLAAFAEAGIEAQMLAWDAPSVPPDRFSLCLIRSTWNYIWHLPAFLAWLASAAAVTQLVNPLPVVRWNVHKRYLRALEAGGLAVTPTLWFTCGESADLAPARARGWQDVVIKPSVSAGSFATRRFGAHEAADAERFLSNLVAERDVMVQPYVAAVARGGERALVWIDGEVTHAVAKQPRFAADAEAVSPATAPTPAEREFVAQTLALVPPPLRETLLYARIDVFVGEDGSLMLSELELVEPSLFLAQHPPALAALVEAVRRRRG
jgi:hypothetical protein